MRIQHNISALNSHRRLGATGGKTAKTLEKLSSGYKINRAGDDAAGLAISEKMRGQIRGLGMAEQNASHGIDLIQTAEGGLNETHAILQRLRELAVQASNGTYQDVNREQLTREYNAAMDEIDRISESTHYNNIKLLDGSLSRDGAVVATAKSGAVPYNAMAAPVSAQGFAMAAFAAPPPLQGVQALGGMRAAPVEININNLTSPVTESNWKFENGVLTITGNGDFKISGNGLTTNRIVVESGKTANITLSGVTIEGKGGSAIYMVGATVNLNLEGENKLSAKYVNYAGIQSFNGVLTIDGTGSMEVKGAGNAAGIGGGKGQDGGSINIKGGTIIFYGGTNAAGIGGGQDGEGGNINITGGAMAGQGGMYGAGIGGGQNRGGGTIHIGGNAAVTAYGFQYSAGIGGGMYGDGGDITISGGIIKAVGGYAGAAIGQGNTSRGNTKVKITGGMIETTELGPAGKIGKGGDTVVTGGNLSLRELPNLVNGTNGKGESIFRVAVNGINFEQYENLAFKIGGVVWNGITDKNGKFFLFLPESASDSEISLSYGGKEYRGTLNVTSDGKGAVTLDEYIPPKYDVEIALPEIGLPPNTDITVTIDGEDKTVQTNGDGDLILELTDGTYEIEISYDDKTYTGTVEVIGSDVKTTLTEKQTKPQPEKPKPEPKPETGDSGKGLVLQIGANGGADQRVTVYIECMNSSHIGVRDDSGNVTTSVRDTSISTREDANAAIDVLDAAINQVSGQRAELGAMQNRLEHTLNNLGVQKENLTDAESVIRDADMAKEMMEFTKLTILSQAAQAMLAQANQLPQGVLSLLR